MSNRLGFNRPLYFIYLFVLAWAPIPLGSNQIWAVSLLEVVIFLMAAYVLLSHALASPSKNINSTLHHNRLILVLFAGHLLYLLFQCIPLPIELIAKANPLKAAWHQTEPVIPNAEIVALTASIPSSLSEFYKQLAYTLFFCLTLYLVDSKKRLFFTIYVLISVALGEAVYGVTARLMGDSFNLWRPTDGMLAGGTFINKNHFAALLSLATSLAIGLCLYHTKVITNVRVGTGIRGFLARSNAFLLSPSAILLGIFLLLMTGILLSQSRGALIFLTLTIFALLGFGVFKQGLKSSEAKVLIYYSGITVVAGIYLLSKAKFSSFFASLTTDSSRLIHWKQTFDMFLDHWIVGVGNGAYQLVFTQFKAGKYRNYLIDYAHNDHLQLLAELGVVGALIWFSLITVAGIRLLKAYRLSHHNRGYQNLLIGPICALVAFLLHGLVDFNFHIPSNALWFYTILALGLVIKERIIQRAWPAAG